MRLKMDFILKKIKTVMPFRARFALLLWVQPVAIFVAFSVLFADGLDDERHIMHRSMINLEYNDNVYQSSGVDEPVREDLVFHYVPNFTFAAFHEKHEASINLSGDYRKGLKTDVSDLNMAVNGVLGTQFNSGLEFAIENTYAENRFNHDVYDRPGTYRARNNDFKANASYTPVERFSVNGGYGFGWTDDGDVVSRYQSYEAGVNTPLTWSAELCLDYGRRVKTSEDANSMNYVNDRLGAGIKWKGPYRFTLSLEGGYEWLDFDDPEYEDHENIRMKAALDVTFTEMSNGAFFIGTDVYRNLTYGLEFDHMTEKDARTFVRVEKSTDMPYTTTRLNPVYETWRARVGHNKTFIDRIKMSVEGGYMEWESYKNGSGDYQKDETWTGSAALDYLMQDKYRFGVYYRYAKRYSTKPMYEYENNVLGCSFTIDF